VKNRSSGAPSSRAGDGGADAETVRIFAASYLAQCRRPSRTACSHNSLTLHMFRSGHPAPTHPNIALICTARVTAVHPLPPDTRDIVHGSPASRAALPCRVTQARRTTVTPVSSRRHSQFQSLFLERVGPSATMPTMPAFHMIRRWTWVIVTDFLHFLPTPLTGPGERGWTRGLKMGPKSG
jgi:hypothetical protein